MSATIQSKRDNYGLKMLLLIVVLTSTLTYTFYKITKGPVAPSFVAPIMLNKPIYILKSYTTALTYQKNGVDKNQYTQKIEHFRRYLTSIGYKTKFIKEDKIDTLEKESILFVLDAVALGGETKESIKSFVKNGGNLFFNFTSGFSDEKGAYLKDSFVNEITQLELSDKNFADFKKGIFLTQRLLSVLNNKNSGILYSTSIYDQIPIFRTPAGKKPDIFLTTYDQTTAPLDEKKNSDFLQEEAGVAWHGYYGKGKYYYMSLPSYIFYDSAKNLDNFKQVTAAIINFLSSEIVIGKFPYIDKENIVFVSQDTEFKFENFIRFSELAKKYKIHTTAFIVSSLAQEEKNVEMVKKISKNPYIEFASHSHLHKKIIDANNSFVKQETAGSKMIIDKYSLKPIIGYRPPREELNSLMKKHLQESGYNYILGKSKQYLYPNLDENYKDILMIPRHGTDDYSYLINLDWDKKQILEQMEKETEFITGLDGIYTLSTHTHLFTYSTNIEIVEEYFKYLKKNPKFQTLDGKSITKRVLQNMSTDISYSILNNTISINISNTADTSVDNFHLRLYKNPNLKIKLTDSDGLKIEIKPKTQDIIDINIEHLKPNCQATIFIELKENL